MVIIKRVKATLPPVFIVVNFQLQERSFTLKSSKIENQYITENIKIGECTVNTVHIYSEFYGFYD